jgi:hypothetical protein
MILHLSGIYTKLASEIGIATGVVSHFPRHRSIMTVANAPRNPLYLRKMVHSVQRPRVLAQFNSPCIRGVELKAFMLRELAIANPVDAIMSLLVYASGAETFGRLDRCDTIRTRQSRLRRECLFHFSDSFPHDQVS